MSRSLTSSDKSALIRLASSLPAGSAERKTVLAGLKKVSRNKKSTSDFRSQVIAAANYIWGSDYDAVPKKDTLYVVLSGAYSLWKGGSNWKTLKELQTEGDDGDIRDFFKKVERIMVEMGPDGDYYPANKVGIVFVGDNGKVEAYSASLHEEKKRLFPEPLSAEQVFLEDLAKKFPKDFMEKKLSHESKLFQAKVEISIPLIYSWPPTANTEFPFYWEKSFQNTGFVQTIPVVIKTKFHLNSNNVKALVGSKTPKEVYQAFEKSAGDYASVDRQGSMKKFLLLVKNFADAKPDATPRSMLITINKAFQEAMAIPDYSAHDSIKVEFTGYSNADLKKVTLANLAKLKLPKLGRK